MSIRVALNHLTEYRYDRPVALSPHVLRLRPAPHCRTPIEAYSLKIEPAGHFINWQQDPFGNFLARAVFPEKIRRLLIEVDLVARMTVINPFDFFLEEYARHYPFDYPAQLAKELGPYLKPVEDGPLLQKQLAAVDTRRQGAVDFLVALNRSLQQHIRYTIRLQPGIQSCETTLSKALGSCRDSAWLLVQMMRHLGLAARFVSGYLIQLAADEPSLDGPSGPEKDFTDLHAWAEVYVPGAGWLGLDPTSGLFAGEGHIPLTCAPDPVSAAPVTGSTDACQTEFYYSNTVQRLHEDPRVTKPYSDAGWEAVQTLGRQVDRDLERMDVRLSMGGEPTFVSIDDMTSAQWHTAADGRHKQRLARDLTRRLQSAFGADGIVSCGQGKWYPAEPLPRWKLACFWRTDGVPLWHHPRLLADPDRDCGLDSKDGLRFIKVLAQVLQVDETHVVPGYEDVLYHLWQEANLPANLDLKACALSDAIERRQLVQVLERGLGQAVGYALPLDWDTGRQCWRSDRWEFRRGQMALMPGNSPMGLRLPLDALPWVAPVKKDSANADGPKAPETLADIAAAVGPPPVLPPLQDDYRLTIDARGRLPAAAPDACEQAEDAAPDREKITHTALCAEVRNGRLYVFMPPVDDLEPYLVLLAAVETAAEKLSLPVIFEGYEPPDDPRLQRLSVTPDPGVIEVNIHPSENWPQLVENTRILYREARQARLGTEKFMVDGRHTGTGGGNHMTLGGLRPADSPFLRRPDLLRSLITFWQHHPGLSYLFSGLFIGPTSQAPRVDEARSEQLYELEIALAQMPDGLTDQYWLTDRLLRHLLTDASGNTHRAEFSIDKLYPLETGGRRLGIVELRAFEMPPHYRMSLVQMLLVRTLIAHFWQTPYRKPLVRWGTELHDRFMLPHYVWADMVDVVGRLQEAGYAFETAWLEPFFEFRFPRYGAVQIGDIEMELRLAIEPWHVLGEEVSRAGTARFVDSSVERLQVKTRGLTDSRYVVTCNGRRVPLTRTGTHGEAVAGVRYKAWQPPSALHPAIGVHTPLVFDIIDTWNARSIGGCTYHVGHPGGRNYETAPINAFEAESRRISRFWEYGHTPGNLQPPPLPPAQPGRFEAYAGPVGPMEPPPAEIPAEYPRTLDLRRAAVWAKSRANR